MARPERIKTELGHRLRAIRLSQGNSDREIFSKKLGLSAKTLGNYERGDSAPDAYTLAQYQKTFDININWLVSGIGNMMLSDNNDDTAIDPERLRVAISAVEEGLARVKKTIQPVTKTDLIMIAYKILGDGNDGEDIKVDNIIRLISIS